MELVFATHNSNKFKEIKKLIPSSINLLSLEDIGCQEEILETSETIAGNALLKAGYIKKNYNLNCFADDTGLEVEALDGKPGVYSARYAGPQKNDEDNIKKLLDSLNSIPHRKAQFKTVIALAIDHRQKTFTGICKGHILTQKQGESGFGYDPVFQPKGYDLSFAEMDLHKKNQISHRAKAIQKLITYLQKNEAYLK